MRQIMLSSFSSLSSAVLFFCPSPDLHLLQSQPSVVEEEVMKCNVACSAAFLSAWSVSSWYFVT